MQYDSLFSTISVEQLKKQYAYKGTISKIFEELQDNNISLETKIYHPTRLIKGLIDYKINSPLSEYLHSSIRNAIEFALDSYESHFIDQSKLNKLKNTLIERHGEQILESLVIQHKDDSACYSSDPQLTQKTTERILKACNGSSIILIPIAHGATAVGLDLYLRYCDISGRKNSAIYPCRFSKHKLKDLTPQLNNDEISYIRQVAHNKTLVIFEENIATGTTLESAADYFQIMLPETYILKETNLNIKEYLINKHLDISQHDEMLQQFEDLQEDDITS